MTRHYPHILTLTFAIILTSALAGCGAAPPPVSGRLPPEDIQRVVRARFRPIQACYEDGLRRNPSLQGRVSVRFVIDRGGTPTEVASSGSDLPDSAVVSCVVTEFKGLHFPPPVGGFVTVTYPLVLSPGDP